MALLMLFLCYSLSMLFHWSERLVNSADVVLLVSHLRVDFLEAVGIDFCALVSALVNGVEPLVFCTPGNPWGVVLPPTFGDYCRRRTNASALKIHIVNLKDNKIRN